MRRSVWVAVCLSCMALFFGFFSLGPAAIKVTPFVNALPSDGSPYSDLAVAQRLKEEGYRLEWALMHALPKKRHYFQRLLFFLQNLRTERFVFNNLNAPFSKASLRRIPQEKLLLILWEPPSVFDHQYAQEVLDLFGTVMTWNDALVGGEKFVKFHYPVLRPLQDNLPPFKEREFLCMIASNLQFNHIKEELYSTRKAAVHYFESQPAGTFDLYGKGWEGYQNSRGRVVDKLATLKRYKFHLCFENCQVPGYITEKIFDSFAVGTIPIYLGATNVTDYIPADCFIDYRQFSSFEEMLKRIACLREEEYQGYLERIKRYLVGAQAQRFTKEAFSASLAEALGHQALSPPPISGHF